ncbi:MAG: CSLREA domain-containing protein [Actinomycetota bacterium]
MKRRPGLLILFFMAASSCQQLEAHATTTTLTVSTAADPGDGVCDQDCTLREALVAANVDTSITAIIFDIPGDGVHVIHLTSTQGGGGPLPAIARPLIVDGETQPGWDLSGGTPVIALDGLRAGAGVDGLRIAADGVTVRGLVVSAFAGHGVVFAQGTGGSLQDSFVGTDASGERADGNAAGGVLVVGPASETELDGDVVSANGGPGIQIDRAAGTRIEDSTVGVDRARSSTLGNGGPGILVQGAAGTQIGTAYSLDQDVIGGNTSGIVVRASNGTPSTDTVIRHASVGAIDSAPTYGLALGNRGAGIVVDNSTGSTIGAIVGGNGGSGIVIQGPGTRGTVVDGSYVGRFRWGPSDTANAGDGILIRGGASSTRIGPAPGAITEGRWPGEWSGGNTIVGNAGDGIRVLSGTGVAIHRNDVEGNGGIGIDLGGDGPTPNDPGDADDGPNDLQNYPWLDAVTYDESTEYATDAGTTVDTAYTGAAHHKVLIDVFAVPSCRGGATGQDAEWRFSQIYSVGDDGTLADRQILSWTGDPLMPGSGATATITDLKTGNTSEFAPCVRILDSDLSVTVTPNPGPDVLVGQPEAFDVAVTNHGPDAARDTFLTVDHLFATDSETQGQLTSVESDHGPCPPDEEGGTFHCEMGALGPGATAHVHAVVRSSGPGPNTIVFAEWTQSFDAGLNDTNQHPVTFAAHCTITGTADADELVGTDGDDVICGVGGDDRIVGNGGDDLLIGGDGNDRIAGGPGDDALLPGQGENAIGGGEGTDTLSYSDAWRGVHVDLAAGTATGWGTDSLVGIENVIGSPYGDEELGDAASNFLIGGAGSDRLAGRAGADRMRARDGRRDAVVGGMGIDRGTVDRRRDRVTGVEHLV